MNFKNVLEENCFKIANEVLGASSARIEHNTVIRIENAVFPEVAAFTGPPKKEVDVLTAEICQRPKITLLVSCKEFSKRAEPAHVQEWAAVVRTMNKYSKGTIFLGLVVSSLGFTSGCESWATSYNLGLIPPLKGKSIAYSPDSVLRMFKRALVALYKRVHINHADLIEPPAFFNFIYSLVSDFEGHEDRLQNERYYLYPNQWISSFGEMYSSVKGQRIETIVANRDSSMLRFTDDLSLRFTGSRVEFGTGINADENVLSLPICFQGIQAEPCTLELVKSAVVGLPITSAADFGCALELGIDRKFNLSMQIGGFHLIPVGNVR